MSLDTQAVNVGDFFEESWGYDQTNVDFYEVVKVSSSGQTVWVRHVRSALVDVNGSATHVAPVPGDYDDHGSVSPTLRKKLRFDSDQPSFTMSSYSNAYLWNCVPAYETAIGWGH